MTVRAWELLVGVLGLLLAAVLLYAGGYAIGFFFLAVAGVWLLSRLRVAEPGYVAGAFALRKGWLLVARTGLLFAIYLGICVAFFLSRRDHWERETPGQVATYALAGLAFLLLRELNRSGNAALNWLTGGWAEQQVGTLLAELRDEGWKVIDNFLRDDGYGNVDHVAWGTSGVYAIETKSGQLRRSHIRQAAGNAAWLKGKLGVPWVTAVVCLAQDAPAEKDGWVWIVGRPQLLDWLRSQPHRRQVASDHSPLPG